MDFGILLLGDQAAFELEKARRGLETAKLALESAKQSYEDVMARAEEAGLSRAKFKKLIDERADALFENGFGETSSVAGVARGSSRVERPKRGKKTANAEGLNAEDSGVHESDDESSNVHHLEQVHNH